MEKRSTLIYDILALAIVAVWGMTFISTIKCLKYLTPSQIFFFRFLVAYIGMWFFAPKPLMSQSWRDEVRLLFAGITGGSLYFFGENTALAVSNQASCISFIVCTTPLVTSLLAIALRRKGARMTAPLAIGSVIALVGIAMVMLNGSVFEGIPVSGYLLAMVASLTWAFYTILIGDISEKYSTAFVARKVFFYGVLTILPVIWVQGVPMNWVAFREPDLILNLTFLALVASLGGYALWTPVIKYLGPVKSTNYLYLNPVFTLIGAVILLGEKMTTLSLIGSIVTLLGVWLAGLKSFRR